MTQEFSNAPTFVSKLRCFADSRFNNLNSDGCASVLANYLYFDGAIKFHCEKIRLGFASVKVGSGNNNGLGEDGCGVLEDCGLPLNGVGSKSLKKVLILMSDTGGGHRASVEAIKAAFNEEFGDEYQVFVTDLWTNHTPWSFNQLPRSYNVLVKHGSLWKMTYYASTPCLVHQSNYAATSTFIAR
ncbi:monogalactosyldiacylglycerol synthase, chloroplastic-like [Cornus florida]|uniref:monogalactosyldiacylglycerol synthase, chloroplastic-like n=1 Tax=Cornus florida TaxID=4283 RepID=UPI00289CBAB6|nr:monogalactosyldiacylglycerol synthase, chloroplastic-like [Cornus florida]